MRARVDVVSVPDALMSEPSEVIRLVVDALEIGPEVMSLADQDSIDRIVDSRFAPALTGIADGVPALLCTMANLGPALAQTAHRFATIIRDSLGGESMEGGTEWTLRVVCLGNHGKLAVEDAYLAGVVVRGLLVELAHASELPQGVQLVLTEEAGFIQAAAGGFPDDLSALAAGSSAYRVDRAALHIGCQRNTIAIVPLICETRH